MPTHDTTRAGNPKEPRPVATAPKRGGIRRGSAPTPRSFLHQKPVQETILNQGRNAFPRISRGDNASPRGRPIACSVVAMDEKSRATVGEAIGAGTGPDREERDRARAFRAIMICHVHAPQSARNRAFPNLGFFRPVIDKSGRARIAKGEQNAIIALVTKIQTTSIL